MSFTVPRSYHDYSNCENFTCRSKRMKRRNYVKSLRMERNTCSICMECVQDEESLITTTCDHTFHVQCWESYVEAHASAMSNQLNNDPQENCPLRVIFGCYFVPIYLGPSCPVCRQNHPLLHHFAKYMSDDGARKQRLRTLTAKDSWVSNTLNNIITFDTLDTLTKANK